MTPQLIRIIAGSLCCLLAGLCPVCADATASVPGLPQADPPQVIADIVYAEPDGHPLMLDLYLPEGVEQPRLLVYIHGGGWRAGDRKRFNIGWLTQYDFAVASIDYRLTDVATFPAQIHDCKAAIRWLRAHADEYGYDASRIGVVGVSAGAHLATLLGVSGGDAELEGAVGDQQDQDSRVQAIVSYFGAYDFISRAGHQPGKTEQPGGSVYRLLGGAVLENPTRAKLASPVWHLTPDDPPLYLLHGDKDTVVLPRQAQLMAQAYEAAELDVTLELVEGAGHSAKQISPPERREQIVSYFHQHLDD